MQKGPYRGRRRLDRPEFFAKRAPASPAKKDAGCKTKASSSKIQPGARALDPVESNCETDFVAAQRGAFARFATERSPARCWRIPRWPLNRRAPPRSRRWAKHTEFPLSPPGNQRQWDDRRLYPHRDKLGVLVEVAPARVLRPRTDDFNQLVRESPAIAAGHRSLCRAKRSIPPCSPRKENRPRSSVKTNRRRHRQNGGGPTGGNFQGTACSNRGS